MKEPMQTTQTSKQFNKGVQELYDAWINGDKLKQWWHPANNKLVHVENEVKEGGTIKYEFETKEGNKSFVITGEYKEVQPASRLVYTWDWEIQGKDKSKANHIELTVEFSGDDNSSKVQITQKDLDANEAVHPHQKGWDEELDSLNNFLS